MLDQAKLDAKPARDWLTHVRGCLRGASPFWNLLASEQWRLTVSQESGNLRSQVCYVCVFAGDALP